MEKLNFDKLLILVSEKMIEFINHFFPGLITFFIFFSGNFKIENLNLYTFIMLSVISIILTIPFHFFLPLRFTENIKIFFYQLNGSEIHKNENLKEQISNLFQVFWFKFVILRLALVFFTSNLLYFYQVSFDFLNICPTFFNALLSFIIMYLLSYPLAFLFIYVENKSLKNNQKFVNHFINRI